MNHSPLPFRTGAIGTEIIASNVVIAFIKGEAADTRTLEQRQADAAFIVTACNAHAPMVKALTALNDESWLDANPCDTDYLAKAKALARTALKVALAEPPQHAAPAIAVLLDRAAAHDERLNLDERVPTGDDYNAIMELVDAMRSALATNPTEGATS